jgi:hypothetical protein
MWWCSYSKGLSIGGGQTLADGFQLAQVQCDNCGRVGHPRERCFNLYPKLISSCGGGCGRAAQKGRGGRSDKGGGVVEVH